MLEMAEFIQQNFSQNSCRILSAHWFDFKFNDHDVCHFASQLINVRYINSPSSRTIKFMIDESSLKRCSSSIFPALFLNIYYVVQSSCCGLNAQCFHLCIAVTNNILSSQVVSVVLVGKLNLIRYMYSSVYYLRYMYVYQL